MDQRQGEQSLEEMKALSPQQRANIEELVQLSPLIIKGRVRRDGISASATTVLNAYARPTAQSDHSAMPAEQGKKRH